ncbi:MAG: spermidine synthase [Planctomycetota bacterium]|jgi:spermidine synthase
MDKRAYLLFLAFLSGVAVMALEMTGARSLSPHFGGSTYIWANIIGCLMASLALGYAVGGRVADRHPRVEPLLILICTAGAMAALIPLVINPLSRACIPEGIPAGHSFRINLLGSLMVTLLLLVPVVFLLGMVPPFLVRLLTLIPEEVGSAAGKVNAFGAVGSIAGTFLPTLILVPWLGPRLTFTVVAGLCLLGGGAGLVLFGEGRVRRLAWLFLLPLVPSALLGGRAIHPGPETLDERDSAYQYIRVYEREGNRFLTMNEGRDEFDSLIVRGKILTEGRYYDYLNLIPLHFDPAVKKRLRVCVVGLAAGVFSRQIHHFFGDLYRVEIDGAEIDPGVLDVGRLYFGLGSPENRNLTSVAADGRLFLEHAHGEFDLIAVDAYSRQLYIPFHLVTEEFFQICLRKLAPGGFVAVNVFDFSAQSPALEAISDTVSRVFKTAYLLRIPGTSNFLLYARRGPLPVNIQTVLNNFDNPAVASRSEVEDLRALVARSIPYRKTHRGGPDGVILTDDRAPIEPLMDASFRRVRSRLRLSASGE